MEEPPLNQTPGALGDLCRLVQTLRGENGCPWDKKQTPESVSIYLIEEVFELVDAIESGSVEDICEELGDVLFHIVFIARMFEESGKFDLFQAARSINEKMIRRHPHVFGDKEVNSSAEVIQNWHKIKLTEKKIDKNQSLLESLPAKLPALIRAYRISDRAAKSGLEWTETAENQKNPASVAGELLEALKDNDSRLASRQFGDMLFALINLARLAEIHPEKALTGSVKIFEKRFRKMEEIVAESRRDFDDVSKEEKKRIWLKVLELIP
jgi:tetrapyrrole methylase family protein/MazG family protein